MDTEAAYYPEVKPKCGFMWKPHKESLCFANRGIMSDLSKIEKWKFEKLFDMGSGYVLNFSNRTFEEFILDATGKGIY